MHLISYISKFTGSEENCYDSLKEIIKKSVGKNNEKNISGVILSKNNYILQFIEGETNLVNELFSIIERDIRHNNARKIIDTEIIERSFSGWNMEYFQINHEHLFDEINIASIIEVYENSFKVNTLESIEFLRTMLEYLDKYHEIYQAKIT